LWEISRKREAFLPMVVVKFICSFIIQDEMTRLVPSYTECHLLILFLRFKKRYLRLVRSKQLTSYVTKLTKILLFNVKVNWPIAQDN
jgi:hypothetical protein